MKTMKPHEKWKAHRPHRGDKITTLVNGGELLGIVSRVDGNICWVKDDYGYDCFIWCFSDGLNKLHTWDRKHPGGKQ